MIKISVSQASKIIGISRKSIQREILNGRLQTHEGLVTLDSLRRAYPSLDLNQDSAKIIKRVDEIKNEAFNNKNKTKVAKDKREVFLLGVINNLQKVIIEQEIIIDKFKEKLNE